MKMFGTILVLALAGQMLIACGPKPADTGTTTTTTTTTSSPAAVTTPAATTTPAMGTTPAPGGEVGSSPAAGSMAAKVDDKAEASGDAAAGTVEGNTVKFPEAGVQFTVPAGWTASSEGGNVSITSPDNQIAAMFLFPPQEQAKATAEAMGQVVDEMLDNVKPDPEPRTGEMAGMQWVTVTGTGDLDGTPVKWGVDMVQAKKPVVVFYLGEASAWEANKAVLEAFDESFLPLEGDGAAGGDAGAGGDEAGGDEAGGADAGGGDEAAGDASPAADEGGH